MSDNQKFKPDWLDDPRHVKGIVYLLYAACGGLLLTDLFYIRHEHFGFAKAVGFYAGFGFGAYVTIVLTAKLWRRIVGKGEDYYDRKP